MPSTLTATHRIVAKWQNSGLEHVQRAYCELGTPIGGVQQLVSRDGVSPIPVPDAYQGMFDALSAILADTDAAISFSLEERTGLIWNPLDFDSIPPFTGRTLVPASQFTLVLRDTAFIKIRVVVLETAEGYVGHSASGLGINANTDDFTNNYNGNTGVGTEPFFWQKSLVDNFILAGGSVAGGTYDLNDRAKRDRGLE